MILVLGKKSLMVNALQNWLKADYLSHDDVFDYDLSKYDTIYLLSFNPNFKKKIERDFDFEKKILSIFENKKIIYPSSSSVYPNKINCKEIDNLDPQSHYGENKIKIEKLIKNYTEKFIIYRISNLFQYDKFTPNTFFNILKNNYLSKEIKFDCNLESIRDFISINSLSLALQQMFNLNKFGIYNIGSMYGLKIIDILKIIFNDYSHLNIKIFDNSLKNKTLSINKILSIIDYKNDYFHLQTLDEINKISFDL